MSMQQGLIHVIFILEKYIRKKLCLRCHRKCGIQFPSVSVPLKSSKYETLKKPLPTPSPTCRSCILHTCTSTRVHTHVCTHAHVHKVIKLATHLGLFFNLTPYSNYTHRKIKPKSEKLMGYYHN
jgi:hypothetical protein